MWQHIVALTGSPDVVCNFIFLLITTAIMTPLIVLAFRGVFSMGLLVLAAFNLIAWSIWGTTLRERVRSRDGGV
jgi:hypothetical protein